MSEPLGVICALVALLAMLAVVGHAIWLGAATILRALFGRSADNGKACPRCHAVLAADAQECLGCGWPMAPGPKARALAALTSTTVHLDRLRTEGALSQQVYARLSDAVEEERHRLLTTAPAAVPPSLAPAPIMPAPIIAEIVAEVVSPRPIVPTPPRPGPPMAPSVVPVPAATVKSATELAADAARRAQEFAARQKQVEPPPIIAPPREPQRPLSQVLARFLEEKNIRWGELIGGLLIVGCSIALVISFWAQIAERPFLKFFLFNGVTASLFGMGLYIHHRWKLPTTSQGLLIIASLLVPLNFLALAAFTAGPAANNPITLAGEVISIALFSWLLLMAGGVVAPPWKWLFAVGVIVPSGLELLVRRLVSPEAGATLVLGVGALPIAVYCGIWSAMIWEARRREFDTALSETIFRILGVTTFATAVPCGLLLARTGHPGQTLHNLAWFVCLFAAPGLATGLLIWRRVTDRELNAIRVAGTSIAVLGVMFLIAGIGLGWPEPARMAPAALVSFGLLTAIAVLFEIPAAHLLAAGCFALTYLIGFNVLRGDVEWRNAEASVLTSALFSAASGVALIPLTALFGAVAIGWTRFKRRPAAIFYGLAAGGVAAVSLALVTWHGFGVQGDPNGATWVYLLYAACAVAAAAAVPRASIGWAACGLLLAASVQGIVFRWAAAWNFGQPWLTAMLVFGTATAVGRLGLRFGTWGGLRNSLCGPLCSSAVTAAGMATLLWLWAIPRELESTLAIQAMWLAGIWLLLAISEASAALFWVFQTSLAVGVVFTVAARLATYPWYRAARFPWLDPWSVQAQAIALGVMALAWLGLRWWGEGEEWLGARGQGLGEEDGGKLSDEGRLSVVRTLRRLVAGDGVAFDQVLSVVVLGALIGIGVYGVLPGVAQELAPRYAVEVGVLGQPQSFPASHYELPGIPHAHALQFGSWLLLSLVVALLIAQAWRELSEWHIVGLVLTAAMVCPLLAGRWETEAAAASALRWCLTGFVVVASIPVWFRVPLVRRINSLGWFRGQMEERDLADAARLLILALTFAPLFLMVLFVGGAAVSRADITADISRLYWMLGPVGVIAGLVGLAMWYVPGMAAQGMHLTRRRVDWLQQSGTLTLILGLAPLLAITLYVVATSLASNPIRGPDAGTFFSRIGLATSYALPVLVLGGVLVGYAIRERNSAFALSAGMLFHLGATAAWLVTAAKGGLRLDAVLWIRLGHLNAIVACGYALAWLAAVTWWMRRQSRRDAERAAAEVAGGADLSGASDAAADGSRREPATLAPGTLAPAVLVTDPLLQLQLLIGVALQAMILIALWLRLFIDPRPSPAIVQGTSVWGWLSFVLAGVALAWLTWRERQAVSVAKCAVGLIAVTALFAFTACRWDTGNWLGYHTLLAGHAINAWAIFGIAVYSAARCFDAEKQRATPGLGIAAFAGTVSVMLALRAVFGDPQLPWWSAGVLLSMSLLAVALAQRSLNRGFIYVAGMLLNLATSIWWLFEGRQLIAPSVGGLGALGGEFVHFLLVNIVALSLPAGVWLWMELRWFRPADGQRMRLTGFHRVAASVALWTLAALTLLGLAGDVVLSSAPGSAIVIWTAVFATASAIIACLWDPSARLSIAHLYLLGLTAIGITLDQFNLPFKTLVWTGGMILAAYSVATSYLWSRRSGLLEIADRLRMPRGSDAPFAGLWWLTPANIACASVVFAVSFWADLNLPELRLRILAAMAALTQTAAVGLLARGTRRSLLQQLALLLGVIGAVAWGWAWLDPYSVNGNLLNRAVVVMTVLAAMTAIYGLGPAKVLPANSEWTQAARRLLPWLIGLGGLSIAFVMAVEIQAAMVQTTVQIAPAALAAVAAALLGLAIAAIAAAVLPGRDPLRLSERGRTAYVYAAEGLLALLLLHIRLTIPWLFQDFLTRYWPFIVMFVAFLGTGLGELFRRRQRVVLSEPLERTGILLPLLPVLGFWGVPNDAHYSLLLLAVGILYAGLSVTRRSFGFGVLAALAANGGLWYLLHHADGFGLLQHPQIWLIPPAVCVLCAAYLNRKVLTDAQMAGIRYLTATTIYVASTADIFLIGVGHAPWLPLVLAGLSILGILAGIMLRVRAFLFLGTSFLVLALFTVIWYAAVDLHQTWLWWASGIVTGMLIIAVFAVFEKKRQEILHAVERLREWQA